VTALDRYVRLESTGLWREHADEAAREVLVSFGNATLVLSGFDEEPLTHWSLAAVQILHQDADRTVFAADVPGSETLEIADPQMVEAIAQVRAGLAHAAAPAPVRRGAGRWIAAALGAVVLGLVAWVGPGWLRDVAFGLIPQDKADLIAEDIRVELPPPCSLPEGRRALRSLVATASPGLDVQVMPWDVPRVARLPDGQVLLARSVVPEATAPEALAGWLALGAVQGCLLYTSDAADDPTRSQHGGLAPTTIALPKPAQALR